MNGTTTRYFIEGDRIVLEKVGDGKAAAFVIYDSTGMHPYYYIRNGQGDVIGLFDASGNVVARYSYDSWGNLLKITDGSGNDKTNDTAFVGYKNPLRYCGYYYDSETKLYYLQSRYYNPEWRRFINADTIVINNLLGTNVFAYCNNNPVLNIDPSGHEAIPYYLDKVWYDVYGHARMDNPKHPDFVYDRSPYEKELTLQRGGAPRGQPRTVNSPDERVPCKIKVLKEGNTTKDQINGKLAIGGATVEVGLGIAGLFLPEPTITKVIGGGFVATGTLSLYLSIDEYNELFTEVDGYEYGGGYIAWNMSKIQKIKLCFIATLICTTIMTLLTIIIVVIDLSDGNSVITIKYIVSYISLIFAWFMPLSIKNHLNKISKD